MNTINTSTEGHRTADGPLGASRTPWPQYTLLYPVVFLMGVETFLVSPLLPTIAADLHASIGATAAVVTAYVLTYAVVGPLVGSVSDRAPRRVFITVGLSVFLLGNVLCGLAQGLGWLIGARAITGFGGAVAGPAMWAYFAETARLDQRGRAVGLGAAFYSLGQVLGVPLAVLVARIADWRWDFLGVAAGLAMVVPLIRWRLSSLQPTGHASLFASFRVWRLRQIRLALLSTGLLQGGRLGSYTYVGVLFSQHFGLSVEQLGLVGMLVGTASLTGSLLAGPLVDRLHKAGRNDAWLSVIWALLFSSAVTVAILATDLTSSLAALFVWFVAGEAFITTQQTYLSSAEPEQRASTVSWNNAMGNIGVALGTSVLGLFTVGSPNFAAITAALGLGACALSVIRTVRKRAKHFGGGYAASVARSGSWVKASPTGGLS